MNSHSGLLAEYFVKHLVKLLNKRFHRLYSAGAKIVPVFYFLKNKSLEC